MTAVRISLAVIAGAVLDHAFAGREPGTAATDHLRSGLVPVLIALVIGWAYPRLRPGGAGRCGDVLVGRWRSSRPARAGRRTA